MNTKAVAALHVSHYFNVFKIYYNLYYFYHLESDFGVGAKYFQLSFF